MNKETSVIQQLKDNTSAFGLMSEEMQVKAKEIGEPAFSVFLVHEDEDQVCFDSTAVRKFDEWASLTFCLRDDYEEQPEIVECEISEDIDMLWFIPPCKEPEEPRDLICDASRYPDFIGFKFEDEIVTGLPIRYKMSGGVFSTFAYKNFAEIEVLHATHVLFRGPK